MEGYRRPNGIPGINGVPDASQAIEPASAFLRQLIPFPTSGSAEALSPLASLAQGMPAAPSNKPADAAALAGEPAASIVAQAASVLDEEMAKGVLAARSYAGMAYPSAGEGHPVLGQMHELVNNIAALWPSLYGAPAQAATAAPAATSGADPLPTLKPRTAARPGERIGLSMSLRNSESRTVQLAPAATDLLGTRDGRIPGALLQFTPAELTLQPKEQKDLVISATIPTDAVPGAYSGLLVIRGLDYLRAVIAIDVTGTAVSTAGLQAPSTAQTAINPGAAPSFAAPRIASFNNSVMQEASKLAEDGELGNSDAIRLLQMQPRPEELKDVLARFDRQLTPEARSKLTLGAYVPLPEGVANQRYEPIFDRYPITGKTHTTAAGTVTLAEVQYYNGEMVQLHGTCANLAGVRKALAGSGYKPMTLRHPNGRESAIVQFWAHQLSDTSLRPYNAMFVIVAAVSEATPDSQACLRADDNGASSLLAMLDGRFDPARRIYQNNAQLYFVRLLDSTRVAVDVGRERMGTDKRPGTIDLRRDGRQRSFAVNDGMGRAVARIQFMPASDSSAFTGPLRKAAATAGIPLGDYPAGTEYIYPGVARIGTAPIVEWQWRTDVTPRFQPVTPGTAVFDAGSEEGRTLLDWQFEPKVLGYIPNVRGVVTGIPDSRG